MRASSVRLGALLLASLPVPASPPDPNPFIASIYDNGREGDVWGQWLDAEQRAMVFARPERAVGEGRGAGEEELR
jgi:hypothetical protein